MKPKPALPLAHSTLTLPPVNVLISAHFPPPWAPYLPIFKLLIAWLQATAPLVHMQMKTAARVQARARQTHTNIISTVCQYALMITSWMPSLKAVWLRHHARTTLMLTTILAVVWTRALALLETLACIAVSPLAMAPSMETHWPALVLVLAAEGSRTMLTLTFVILTVCQAHSPAQLMVVASHHAPPLTTLTLTLWYVWCRALWASLPHSVISYLMAAECVR